MQKRLNRSSCRPGDDSCGSKEPCVRWGVQIPTIMGTCEGDICWPIITYLRMSALHTVRLPPRANVPAQGSGGRMHSPLRGLTRRRCGLLPNYSVDLLVYCCSVVRRWRASNYSAFWGMTLDEGIRYRLGTFRPINPVNKMTSLRVFTDDGLPQSFDSRVEWPGLIGGVLDQGNCASSWAFSTTG